MKNIQRFIFGLSALGAVAFAQEGDSSAKQEAIVQIGTRGNPERLVIDKANGRNKFQYVKRGDTTATEVEVRRCNIFFMETPKDLADAIVLFRSNDLERARRQLGRVKKKYEHFIGLPGNASAQAALYELRTAIRQMDWAGVKQLVASYPGVSSLSPADAGFLKVAAILGEISGGASALRGQSDAIREQNKNKDLTAESYGLLRYAYAAYNDSRIPASAISSGVLNEEQAKIANRAIDNYCQAAMSNRGAHMEVPIAAMKRAVTLLWAMPKVKAYADSIKNVRSLTEAEWKKAPQDFKDAVAMARMVREVFDPEGDDAAIKRISTFFFNENKADPNEEKK